MNIHDDRVKQSSTYELYEFNVIDADDDTFMYVSYSKDAAIDELIKLKEIEPDRYLRIKSITYLMYDLVKVV